MKSLFEAKTYQEIMERLNMLTPESQRRWGKMNTGQMAWHCQFPLKLAFNNQDLGVHGNPLVR